MGVVRDQCGSGGYELEQEVDLGLISREEGLDEGDEDWASRLRISMMFKRGDA